MCRYQKVRTKDYQKYIYCSNPNNKGTVTLEECKECHNRAYKQVKPIKQTPIRKTVCVIRKKSSKLRNKEAKRTSILNTEKGTCFLCGAKHIHTDHHEAFGGCNRQKSIEHRLVFYLCRECHQKADIDKEIRQQLHNIAREKFLEIHTDEEFLREFGKRYIEK